MREPIGITDDGRPIFDVQNIDGEIVGTWSPNPDQELTEGLLERNTRYERPVIVPVPLTISPAQLRIAVRRALFMDSAALDSFVSAVFANIADDGEREDAETLWTFSTTIERSHPLVVAAAAALSLDDEQVDNLFRIAATI